MALRKPIGGARSFYGEGWVSGWASRHADAPEEPEYEAPGEFFERQRPPARPREQMPDPTAIVGYQRQAGAFFWRFIVAGLLSLIPGLGWLLWVAAAFGIASIFFFCKFASTKL